MDPRDKSDFRDDFGDAHVNAEQRGEDQAQDIAEEALQLRSGDQDDAFASTKPHGGLGVAGDDDLHDVVDEMKSMVASGRIDMGAYAGEPMMDDGDTDISDEEITDGLIGGAGDDDIGGRVDDFDLESIADTGDDPLGSIASDHGLEDETADDDIDDADIDEDELPGGLVLGEEAIDRLAEIDDEEADR